MRSGEGDKRRSFGTRFRWSDCLMVSELEMEECPEMD